MIGLNIVTIIKFRIIHIKINPIFKKLLALSLYLFPTKRWSKSSIERQP